MHLLCRDYYPLLQVTPLYKGNADMEYSIPIVPLIDIIFRVPLLSYDGELWSIQNILQNIISIIVERYVIGLQ